VAQEPYPNGFDAVAVTRVARHRLDEDGPLLGVLCQIGPGIHATVAHAAQVAVAGVAHHVRVAHALAVSLGDEADAQRVRAQPLKLVDLEPGQLRLIGEDAAGRPRV
jgi:hypothetical protein